MQDKFSTKEVADKLGVDKSTLLRWIRQEKIPDVIHRDGRNWRVWLWEDVERAMEYHGKIHQLTLNLNSNGNGKEASGEEDEFDLPQTEFEF